MRHPDACKRMRVTRGPSSRVETQEAFPASRLNHGSTSNDIPMPPASVSPTPSRAPSVGAAADANVGAMMYSALNSLDLEPNSSCSMCSFLNQMTDDHAKLREVDPTAPLPPLSVWLTRKGDELSVEQRAISETIAVKRHALDSLMIGAPACTHRTVRTRRPVRAPPAFVWVAPPHVAHPPILEVKKYQNSIDILEKKQTSLRDFAQWCPAATPLAPAPLAALQAPRFRGSHTGGFPPRAQKAASQMAGGEAASHLPAVSNPALSEADRVKAFSTLIQGCTASRSLNNNPELVQAAVAFRYFSSSLDATAWEQQSESGAMWTRLTVLLLQSIALPSTLANTQTTLLQIVNDVLKRCNHCTTLAPQLQLHPAPTDVVMQEHLWQVTPH
eukprot:gene4224-4526_t